MRGFNELREGGDVIQKFKNSKKKQIL